MSKLTGSGASDNIGRTGPYMMLLWPSLAAHANVFYVGSTSPMSW